MTKYFELLIILIMLSSLTARRYNDSAPSLSHYTNLVVGGGAAGLYSAWRLSSQRSQNETTAIYEWSPTRLGGRVFTKTFSSGQFLELGAMRFTTKNRLLLQLLRELKLSNSVKEFPMTDNRLYYVRGTHIYQKEISKKGMPYRTANRREETDKLLAKIANEMGAPPATSRTEWCKFFDESIFPANVGSKAFKENDTLGNIGFWDLLVDQFGNEGFAYVADIAGHTTDVLNSNAAYSIFNHERLRPSTDFRRLRSGFSTLINKLEEESVNRKVQIHKGQRMTEFHWNAKEGKFHSTFLEYGKNGLSNGRILRVTSDRLFLCLPKRSLDLIKETDVVGDTWPAFEEKRVFKHTRGEFYINSVIQVPMYKVALVYDDPWWLNATYKPDFNGSSNHVSYDIASMKNYGPTITDLPLRNIYYFGSNNQSQRANPEYGIIAAYNDMRYTSFWRELELSPNERHRTKQPLFLHPLFMGTEITDTMHRMLQDQLNSVHYGSSAGLKVPAAKKGYFLDWGHDPYGAGIHAWKAHYKIAEAQYYMTRPSEAINIEVPVFVAGEAYSFDQGWVEGALTTAEAILVDKIGLDPLLKTHTEYPLICRLKPKI